MGDPPHERVMTCGPGFAFLLYGFGGERLADFILRVMFGLTSAKQTSGTVPGDDNETVVDTTSTDRG